MSVADQAAPSTTKNRVTSQQGQNFDNIWHDTKHRPFADRDSVAFAALTNQTVQSLPSVLWPQAPGQQAQPYYGSSKILPGPNGVFHPAPPTNNLPDLWAPDAQDIPTPSSMPNRDFLSPVYSSDNFPSDISTSASSLRDDVFWAQPNYDADDQNQVTYQIPKSWGIVSEDFINNSDPDCLPEKAKPLLLTPESDEFTSPPHIQPQVQMASSQPYYVGPLSAAPSLAGQGAEGWPSPSLDSRLTAPYPEISRHGSPLEAPAKSTNPQVLVTSHDKEESPARPSVGQERPRSKRSRSSNSTGYSGSDQTASSGEDQQNDASNQEPRNDPSDLAEERTGFTGFDPTSRGEEYVPSLQDMAEAQKVAEKNADVEDWLEKSEVGSDIDPDEPISLRKKLAKKQKPRALSAGAKATGAGNVSDRQIPGPGALIDEESGEEDSDVLDASEPESPPAPVEIEPHRPRSAYFPSQATGRAETSVEEEPGLSSHSYLPQPWHDPFKGTPIINEQIQPGTANAAMYKFELQAARFETASRTATWGTRRRISDSDIRSLLSDESSLRRLSLTPLHSPSDRSRKSSILGQALDHARGIMRRSSANKPRFSSPIAEVADDAMTEAEREGSGANLLSVQHTTSTSKRPRSPSLTTTSAVMAMTGQIASIGGRGSLSPSAVSPKAVQQRSTTRQRSRSEMPSTKSSGTPGLAQLMTNLGGPPVPTLASPPHGRNKGKEVLPQKSHSDDEVDDEELEEEDATKGKGVKMDFNVRAANIVPTVEGFKTHARELNPRVSDFLLDPVATEQLRRYKKLMEHKVKHAQAVERNKKCPSGKHCNELGEGPTILEPRRSAKDPTSTTQFAVPGDDSDEDAVESAEGAVNPAAFPEGISLPPVKRLPAEFECTLCFKVKKFQKPSDWTKHVHEDVQPFTCTFPRCTEPKSFKRKADWVRHENERHRQLEWWQCNVPECRHICYRKDNFVQHLVREHKKPEPKIKPRGSVNKAALAEAREIDEVWRVVDDCHRETDKKPRDEPCKFCGNVCNSWKRLTVHLARHMEQISLPVLKMVDQKHVSPDTVISPLPPQLKPHYSESLSPIALKVERGSNSPHAARVFTSPAGTSAAAERIFYAQHIQQPQQQPQQQGFIDMHQYSPVPQYQAPDMSPFSQQPGYGVPFGITTYPPQTQSPVNNHAASTYPPPFNAIPRHLQHCASPTPSTTSHPSFALTMDHVYTSQPSSATQPMYSSPVEGPMGFAEIADPHHVGVDVTMAYSASDHGPYTSYDGSNAGTPGLMGPQSHANPQQDYRFQ